ncbi:MAG: hypothetical protein J2P37_26855 [Ktedonobacteraceae bacterium]|nr:hypothetical protein [Ktedonobacteraceae bacterium]
MYSAIYAYPWDVQDETPEVFCANVREKLGVDTVSLAVSYHAGKLLLPHNPRRKVYYPEDGAVYFRPDPAAFAGSVIKPHVSALAREEDMLAALCAVAEREGLGVIAWTVCLHNTRLGMAYPAYAPRNAFGDAAITYLCPSHPEVRAYVCALASDLARRYPLRAIQLEAAHHMPFVHGFHHEMQQVVITPALQILLGLCFCPACLELAHEFNVDGERVSAYVRGEVEQRWRSEDGREGEEARLRKHWWDSLDGELERYFALRHESVRRLLSEVHQAVHAVSTAAVHLQDPSANGARQFSASDLAWQAGLEIPPRAGIADGITMLGYIANIADFRREVDGYCAAVLPRMPLEVGMRPALPDNKSFDEFATKVAYCAKRQVTGVSFYNYGMLPESRLRWIKEALAAV